METYKGTSVVHLNKKMEETLRNRLSKAISALEEVKKDLKEIASGIANEGNNGFEGNDENAETINEVANWIGQHNEDLKDILEG